MKAWPRNSRLACATKAPVVFARWPGAAHRVPGAHVVGDVGDDGPRFGHPAQQVGHVRADLTHRFRMVTSWSPGTSAWCATCRTEAWTPHSAAAAWPSLHLLASGPYRAA